MNNKVRILGIDPGLVKTGWGVIDCDGGKCTYVAHGTISSTNKFSLTNRLLKIYEEMYLVIDEFDPDCAAIEQFFVGKNGATTISSIHARGALLLACGQADLSLEEYAPSNVKKCITGEGCALKAEVAYEVLRFLGEEESDLKLNSHESDALALAICYVRLKKPAPTY